MENLSENNWRVTKIVCTNILLFCFCETWICTIILSNAHNDQIQFNLSIIFETIIIYSIISLSQFFQLINGSLV